MLTCEEITGLVTDFFEGRMSWTDRARFALHVEMCPGCRAYVRHMRFVVAVLGALPPEPIPDDVMEGLVQTFANWRS
jgi:anti-sigma factor ChrR (cupin superfamily)